jgi:hypothetical protein
MRFSIAMAWSHAERDRGIEPRQRLFPFCSTTCGADWRGEFTLANRCYCYPLTITDFASHSQFACHVTRNHQGTQNETNVLPEEMGNSSAVHPRCETGNW